MLRGAPNRRDVIGSLFHPTYDYIVPYGATLNQTTLRLLMEINPNSGKCCANRMIRSIRCLQMKVSMILVSDNI